MSGWNTEHIPVNIYRKYNKNFIASDGSKPYQNGYPFRDELDITIVYACGAEMPRAYSSRVKPALNRKICKRCEGLYFPGFIENKAWQRFAKR